ncbi:hypothetical protein RND81_03G154700 [Saponaria officinalis]|uniref:Uncharacterized protein n=1 Tax=Saponaria officinalis TaxID=3572 RepID=A0AAW1MB22_SAPOF
MEVVVLPPQDALKRHHHHHHHQRRLISPNKPRRNSTNPNTTVQSTRSSRRRRSSNSPPPPRPVSPTLTGPIRILKRGEDLDLVKPAGLEPEPEAVEPVVPGPIGPMFINGFYAGSACVTSPAPSELPVPAFFSRSEDNNQKIADDLRRVLKLF